jgi:hypothetical protein
MSCQIDGAVAVRHDHAPVGDSQHPLRYACDDRHGFAGVKQALDNLTVAIALDLPI